MSLPINKVKQELLDTFIQRMVVDYDKKNDCYYIGIPSNIIVHSVGTVILKGGDSIIVTADQIQLNPPKTFFESASEKLKQLFKV